MYSRKEIEEKVISVVTETLALASPATLDSSLREDLGADSIDIVTLVVSLQDELDSQFEVNDLQGKDTLNEVVNFIEELFASNAVPA